jgi:hypothetical protein
MLQESVLQSTLGGTSPQTYAQGHGIAAGGAVNTYNHVQFWAPSQVPVYWVIHQVAVAISNENQDEPAGALNAVNFFYHATQLTTPAYARFSNLTYHAVTPRGQCRTESAAAPLGTLGELLLSVPVVPTVAQNLIPAGGGGTATNLGMGQALVFPVKWEGAFFSTPYGITAVNQDPCIGLHVAFWWTEYRVNG